MTGEDIVLSGKVELVGATCRVLLDDGQSFVLPRCPNPISTQPFKIVVTTEANYQTDKKQLAQHLLAEILNGSS